MYCISYKMKGTSMTEYKLSEGEKRLNDLLEFWDDEGGKNTIQLSALKLLEVLKKKHVISNEELTAILGSEEDDDTE